MNLLRRILAGSDFSTGAGHTAHSAALISKETGVALELFHSTNLSGLDKLRRRVPWVPEGLEQQATDAGHVLCIQGSADPECAEGYTDRTHPDRVDVSRGRNGE